MPEGSHLNAPGDLNWRTGLSVDQPRKVYVVGTLSLHYELLDRDGWIEVRFFLLPHGLLDACRPRRAVVSELNGPQVEGISLSGDRAGDHCVQLALRGSGFNGGFGSGQTMRNGVDVRALKFRSQQVAARAGRLWVNTEFDHPTGLRVIHRVVADRRWPGVSVSTEVVNRGTDSVVLEHLSSFVLGGLSPLAEDEMTDRLELRRVRSAWCAEGRLVRESFEQLHMERSWSGHAVKSVRFGQVGSMPVRGYHPLVALADLGTGVTWAATVLCPGSWQIEVSRRDDPVAISGGQGDFDFAHWAKTLLPGASYHSPISWLTAVDEVKGVDWMESLNGVHRVFKHSEPPLEASLPVIFNEWCSSWGNPSHENVVSAGRVAAELGVDVFVIDDGWAEKEGRGFQFNGDWVVDKKRFPGGLKSTVRALNSLGLKAGIWFEMECCTDGTRAFDLPGRHLCRYGSPLQVGNRRFWDFRKREVREHLWALIVEPLKACGFEYLKIDYNDSIGVGCDSLDPVGSLGEGLREQLEAVQSFVETVRTEMPQLVVESCSSGGHRLESGWVSMTSLSSSSDSHETPEIPIVSANTHRLIPPAKNLVWAVIRVGHDMGYLEYALSSTFLGRMCLSGDLCNLKSAQLDCIQEAIQFYRAAAPIIGDGGSRVYREIGSSNYHPTGWQIVRRVSTDGDRALIVAHHFGIERNHVVDPPSALMPAGSWRISKRFGAMGLDLIDSSQIVLSDKTPFSGGALILERIA